MNAQKAQRARLRPAEHDEAEAARILRYVLPTVACGKRLQNITFILNGGSCMFLRLNAPAAVGLTEQGLGALMSSADNRFGDWLAGSDEINGTDDETDPFFIESPWNECLADGRTEYQTQLPFMYRVCAWLEFLVPADDGLTEVDVDDDFRAFVILGDDFSIVDVALRARAATLNAPFQDYLETLTHNRDRFCIPAHLL